MQSLSLICDEILAGENQDVVEAAGERISVETEREDIEQKLKGQDVREQGEGGAAWAASRMRIVKDRTRSLKMKRNRKLRRIKPPQASVYIDGTRSLAHNHPQHLHRPGS